jgi:hypothetical protein
VDLTPKQREAYELRNSTDPPMTWREVGRQMGISPITARRHASMAEDKLENPGALGAPNNTPDIEYREPDKTAEMIDLATNPLLDSVKKACEEADLPYEATRALIKRLDRDLQPVGDEVKRVKTDTLVRKFENLALNLIDSVDEAAIKKMQPYQRVVASAIAVDKRELLDGRPTERLSVEDRRQLPELMQAMLIEAERRGLIREVNPETGKVRLADRVDATPGARMGRERMKEIEAEIV